MPQAAEFALIWSAASGDYELHEQGRGPLLRGDEPAWFDWLAVHPAFSFQGQNGQISLLKERRKNAGEGYWYAYRRHGERTVKSYVGRSSGLSMARLEQAARALFPVPVASNAPAQAPLLEPKLMLPRLHQPLVDRSHLLARLDATGAARLTVLSAPAGFGKTTLVRQWIAARPHIPVAWVSLDAGDNDSVRFWRYLITACRFWLPDGGREALERLGAAPAPPFDPSPLETVLTTFLNGLAQAHRDGVLILEDYHVITAPSIHEALAFFLDHLPGALHVLILTRQELPLPLARWRLRGDLCELDTADLRFSAAETEAFLQQTTGAPATADTVQLLDRRLEGWAAGLRLFGVLLKGRRSDAEIEQTLAQLAGGHRPLLDYFVSEVLESQPEPLQRFLLQTSLLTRLNGSLCDAVMDRTDSTALLDSLERAGFFLERLDGPEPWYRYHGLFAEAMQAEAHRRLGESAIRHLAGAASRWYDQHNLLTEAIEASLAAGELAHAADLIDRRIGAPWFGRTREPATLIRWLSHLPDDLLVQHPALCLAFALALATSLGLHLPPPDLLQRAGALLDMAEAAWRASGDMAGVGEVLAFRAYIAQRQGRQTDAVALARQAIALRPPEDKAWRAICLAVLGWADLQEGQVTAAHSRFVEMRSLWADIGNIHALRSSIIALGKIYLAQGALHLAACHFQPALAEALEYGDPDDIAPAQLGLAELHYEWNELAEAKAAAEAAVAYAAQIEDRQQQAQAELLLARISQAQGERPQLAGLLAQFLPQRDLETYRDVLTCQARLLLGAGEREAAWRCFRTLAAAAALSEAGALLEVRLALCDGDTEAALQSLAGLLSAAEAAGRLRNAMEIKLLMALAYGARRQVQEAREVLRQVMAAAHAEGYIRLFVDEGEALAGLLTGLLPTLRERRLQAYGRRLLAALGGRPTEVTALPFAGALTAQERKVLRLLEAGRSNPEIAAELVVSVNTVKAHLKSIYGKLNVRNRQEAGAAWRRLRTQP